MPTAACDVQVHTETPALCRLFVLSIAVHESRKTLGDGIEERLFGLGIVRPTADVQTNIFDLELGQRSQWLLRVEHDFRQAPRCSGAGRRASRSSGCYTGWLR
jgi:hypothetical protein